MLESSNIHMRNLLYAYSWTRAERTCEPQLLHLSQIRASLISLLGGWRKKNKYKSNYFVNHACE